MGQPFSYFDNAATSHPKPESVIEACTDFLRQGGNPGRGSHQLALSAARLIFEARVTIASFLGIKRTERLIFTPGCTQSINMLLSGFGLKSGDLVLIGPLEHNAVTRPLHKMQAQLGIKLEVLPYAKTGIVNKEDLLAACRNLRPRLCVMSHASNVTGEVIDLEMVVATTKKYGVPLLVDAAQSAGPLFAKSGVRLEDLGVDMWCAAGHKGLLGIPGAGLAYIAEGIEIEPLVLGGTGSNSESLEMPEFYPDHLESGTPPGPAIAALAAGVAHIKEIGAQVLFQHEDALRQEFVDWAKKYGDRIELLGAAYQAGSDYRGSKANAHSVLAPLISFRLHNMAPNVVSDILDREYNIVVRSGLHCAALAHQTLGTSALGAVRVSFGCYNQMDEIRTLCDALDKLFRNG
jgi:cysteine desulfurase family protein